MFEVERREHIVMRNRMMILASFGHVLGSGLC